MPDRGVALELAGVTKVYTMDHGPIRVLDGITLDIAAGDVCAIVGPSGSGKSTLLNLLGLLDQPTAGIITYDGVPLLNSRADVIEEFRNRHIGFVFQFHHLLPEFTALENAMMPAVIAGMTMSDARAQARELLLHRDQLLVQVGQLGEHLALVHLGAGEVAGGVVLGARPPHEHQQDQDHQPDQAAAPQKRRTAVRQPSTPSTTPAAARPTRWPAGRKARVSLPRARCR